MDIRELKYFAQVAKDGNYSTAANKLCISQPALSKVIQKMESELGIELFYTFQRRQKLTDMGEMLLKNSIRVISEYDSIIESTYMDKPVYLGRVYIGFPPIAGICYMSELISGFSKRYPGIKIYIKEAGSQKIIEDVEAGVLDVGCVSAPMSEDKFDHALFVRDRYALAVSKQHWLAGREEVTLQELRNESFLVSDGSFSTHNAMRYACREAGFEPKLALNSSRWDFIIQMVRLNYGISFQPYSIFQRFFFPDVCLLNVEHPVMEHSLHLITKKDGYVSRSVNCFIGFIMEQMEKDPNATTLVSPLARRID